MKILHTSDWHLGQHFINRTRLDEHKQFVGWLLEQVVELEVDAVLIAGDIFDTGSPPSYARQLYNSFVIELNKLGCQLIVLGGNHDSVSMLNESKGLLAYLNTQVVAKVASDVSEQLMVINDKAGKASAILCAIPYIRPADVMKSQAGDSQVKKQQTLSQAISQHYHKVYALALDKREEMGGSLPIIATGHLTAMGVKCSESVRDIYIGSLDGFPASAFPPADYIALGHIHRPQVVAQSEHIRYSGSPIPLSFDELSSDKQVLLVEFNEAALVAVTPVNVPVFQPMKLIKGDLDSIQSQVRSLTSHRGDKPVWLCIEVHTQDYLNDLQARIQAMTDGLFVEVLQLRRSRSVNQAQIERQKQEMLDELSVFEVFERRLKQEDFETDQGQQQLTRIRQVYQNIVEEVSNVECDT